MGALLRSVAVPGWGQFYNRRYIKAGVVFIAESFFIYEAARWWKKTEDQYDKVLLTPEDQDQFYQFQLYKSYRGTRDDYLWLVGITVFVSMFDAYVDAHLAGFDVDLTPDFEPREHKSSLSLVLRF